MSLRPIEPDRSFDIFNIKRMLLLKSGDDHDKVSTCIGIYCLRAWWLINCPHDMNRGDASVDLDLDCSTFLSPDVDLDLGCGLYFPVS